MLAKRIIPCLDVNKGRVVKGVKFLDLKDAGDPVELAKKYAKDSNQTEIYEKAEKRIKLLRMKYEEIK